LENGTTLLRPASLDGQQQRSGERRKVGDVAAPVPREEILRSYPALTDPDIDAALAYAAELTREGTVDLPLEIRA
jgi:hypothetical protein